MAIDYMDAEMEAEMERRKAEYVPGHLTAEEYRNMTEQEQSYARYLDRCFGSKDDEIEILDPNDERVLKHQQKRAARGLM